MPPSAFRLLSGAAAPDAKPAGVCVEIVFVGIRLCDRLKYAISPDHADSAISITRRGATR